MLEYFEYSLAVFYSSLKDNLVSNEDNKKCLLSCLSALRNVSSATSYNYQILSKTNICNLVVDFLSSLDNIPVTQVMTNNEILMLYETSFYALGNLAYYKPLGDQFNSIEKIHEIVVKKLELLSTMFSLDQQLYLELCEPFLMLLNHLSKDDRDDKRSILNIECLIQLVRMRDLHTSLSENINTIILQIIKSNTLLEEEAKSLGFV